MRKGGKGERFDLLGSLFSFPPSVMIKKLHESRNEQNGDLTKFTKYYFLTFLKTVEATVEVRDEVVTLETSSNSKTHITRYCALIQSQLIKISN